MEIGSEIPDVLVQQIVDGDVKNISLKDLSAGRKVMMIGVPGAFAPPCAETHVPGYLASVDAFAAKGVDEIVVLASNDFFVVKAWSDQICPDGALRFLADGSQRFAKAADQLLDLTDMGLGHRSQRYAVLIEDGRVAKFFVEPVATEVTVTGSDAVLQHL
ncbi:peroxiredoxin family protein [Actibacterium sp.]|uniref:peroxiredoxin family protein n=1 Tax=Actibacterium sp. TaxID=1872125 RepID=UPI003564CDFC